MFQADVVEIRVMVDNWVDMLLPERHVHQNDCLVDVERCGLIEHFDPKRVPPQAENGLALLVRVVKGRSATTVLFDAGLTGSVLRHNWTALEENPKNVDCIVLSHGHPDHYGGIYEMLSLMERQMPVICHDDAFLPRIALMGDGRGSPFYTAQFSEDGVERAGGRVATVRDPVELGWGLRTTGEIPRLSAFEGTPRPVDERGPGLYQLRAGKVVVDEVLDEQALVVDIRGRGLVCITGCGHAGVTNTIMRAIEISGEKPIVGVIGGFHLGFPTTPTENVDKTIDFLKSVDVRHVVPMHCTGLAAVAAMNRALGDGFVQPAVGTTIRVTAGNRG